MQAAVAGMAAYRRHFAPGLWEDREKTGVEVSGREKKAWGGRKTKEAQTRFWLKVACGVLKGEPSLAISLKTKIDLHFSARRKEI